MRLLLLLIVMLLQAGDAWANVESPLTYSRTNILILRASGNTEPEPEKKETLPWRKGEDAQETADTLSGLVFDVEVRDASVMYNQSGWYNLSSMSDQSGVMLMFDHPGIAPVSASAQYVPLDVLMVDEEGIISQIVPNLMMSQMTADILPTAPVKAFLILKGGTCSAMRIQPGDRVLYKQFKQPPTVLSVPSGSPAPAPVAPATTSSPAPPREPLLDKPAGGDLPVDEALIPNGLLTPEDMEGAGPVTQQPPRRKSSGPLMVPVE